VKLSVRQQLKAKLASSKMSDYDSGGATNDVPEMPRATEQSIRRSFTV